MAITVGDDAVLLDGTERIKFFRDADYAAAPPLVAFSGDNQTLLQCTPEGRLKIDASVTIGNVDIGDVGMFLDVGGVNHLWNGVLNPDATTYAAWVQDQRMSFTGTRLRVDTEMVFPSDYPDAGTHSRLDTLNARDFATQTTLAAINAKLNSLGQKTMAGSVPAVLASDHSDIRVTLRDGSGNGIGSLQDASGAWSINANLRGLGKRVSTLNSSSTPLGANAEFIGTVEDITNYADISVFVYANVSSATDGLKIQWSTDGINFDESDSFSITPAGTKLFTFGCTTRFFRVRYLNGASAQASFRLQTILHPVHLKPSSHRIADAIGTQNDAELVRAVIAGADISDGMFRNVGISGSRLLVSQEPPQPPAGTTPRVITGYSSVAGTVDDVFVIPNGTVLNIQRFSGGSASAVGGGGKIELWNDIAGTGVGMTIIEVIYANGASRSVDIAETYTGNGTRAIRMRRTNTGGGSIEIFGRWTGFTTP